METRGIQMLPMNSSFRGPLSAGCEQCAEGAKMVLFVTGLCRFRCFYCPVSPKRNQKDVTYANERLVLSDDDVITEARVIAAKGTGITGGDPLGVVDRVEHYIRLLKREFGPDHHIHLYTHEPNGDKLRRLAEAGLDEFRLHIPHYLWGPLSSSGGAYREVLEKAPEWGLRRGVEIPVLPEKGRELASLLQALDPLGLDFINLNELEFSETNEANLLQRGYHGSSADGWGVAGSRAVAERMVRRSRLQTPIHFCSSRFKDGVQLRERLKRRARLTAPRFARRTDDGTIRLGVVEVPEIDQLGSTARKLARLARLRSGSYRLDFERRRVELSAARLRRVAGRIDFPAFEVEEYPTADRFEVERAPINSAAWPKLAFKGGT